MEAVFEKSDAFVMKTYKRFRVAFEYGKGVYLYSLDGKQYLDFLAGIAVNTLGHSHEVVVQALQEQAEKLIHVSNLYYIKEQAELAQLLVENSCCDKVFFSNSGAEANETAIKIARKWGNPEKFKILSFNNSFHGRTIATLALTGQKKYQKGFEPFPDGFEYVNFNDFSDFKSKVDEKTVAVFVEFVQGEGGINVADREFIKSVYDYCKDNGMLFIADEIQTGIGRTGKLFAYEHYGIEPDIITLAKGIASGFPMGATLAKGDVADALGFGDHGSTFGGNPLACRVAFGVLGYVLKRGLVEHAAYMGDYLLKGLREITEGKESVVRVDGLGLMVGVEFSDGKKAEDIVKKAFEHYILLGKAGEKTVRLEPPLIVEKPHIDKVLEFFRQHI